MMWRPRNLMVLLIPSALLSHPPAPPNPPPAAAVALVGGDADDPIALAAREAIVVGSVEPALAWVSPPDAAILREAFARAASVRSRGGDGRAVADEYFLLVLRRLHQISGGGERYRGDERIDAAIADAVEAGRAERVTRLIAAAVEEGAGARMKRVLATRKKTGGATAAARLAYLDACLEFARYVERLAVAAADAVDPGDDAYGEGPE